VGLPFYPLLPFAVDSDVVSNDDDDYLFWFRNDDDDCLVWFWLDLLFALEDYAGAEIVGACAEVPSVAKVGAVDSEDCNILLWRVFGGDNGLIVKFDNHFGLKGVREVEVAVLRWFWCCRVCVFGMPMFHSILPCNTPRRDGLQRNSHRGILPWSVNGIEECFDLLWIVRTVSAGLMLRSAVCDLVSLLNTIQQYGNFGREQEYTIQSWCARLIATHIGLFRVVVRVLTIYVALVGYSLDGDEQRWMDCDNKSSSNILARWVFKDVPSSSQGKMDFPKSNCNFCLPSALKSA